MMIFLHLIYLKMSLRIFYHRFIWTILWAYMVTLTCWPLHPMPTWLFPSWWHRLILIIYFFKSILELNSIYNIICIYSSNPEGICSNLVLFLDVSYPRNGLKWFSFLHRNSGERIKWKYSYGEICQN